MADDYFDHVFYTFLGLDSVNCLAVNGTVTSLPVFIQNILNFVPKKNKAGVKWDYGYGDMAHILHDHILHT